MLSPVASVLPSTRRRWAVVAILCLAVGVGIPWLLSRADAPELPMVLKNVTAEWTPDHLAIILKVGHRTYTTTCPRVLISRWLLTAHGRVFTDATAIAGPSLSEGRLAPVRVISIKPESQPGSTLRLAVPDWVRDERNQEIILGVLSEASVPDEQPCANGFTGRYPLYEVLMPTAEPRSTNP